MILLVPPRAVYAYLLVAGLVAGLSQVVLFRELLVVATGTELVIGILIAVWLVAAAAGSVWGDRGATNPIAGARRAWKLAWLAATALGMGVLIVRGARPLLGHLPSAVAEFFPKGSKLAYLFERLIAVQPGEALGLFHVATVALAATALPGFVSGAQFVTGARLLGGRRGAVSAYAIDAIGHLAGGVALAFAATVWLDGLAVAALVALAALGSGAVVVPRPRGSEIRKATVGALVIAGLCAYLAPPSRTWRSPLAEVVDERAGICGLVTVAAQKGGGVYFFIDGAPAGASPPTPRTEVLVNFALAQVEKPKRILVVGGAINGALRECLKHKPEHVDCVEFDPVVLRMARKWSVDEDRLALSDPRVTTVAADPRLFLRRAQQGYDAIILTLAAPATALINRFYTVEWFRLCYQKLNPGGVVSFSLPYDQVYQDQTLAAFDRTIVTSAQSAARPRTAQTAILAGAELVVALRADGPPLAQEPDVVLRRLSQRGVEAPYLQAFVFDWADKNNLAQAHQMLNGPPECNSDARPVAYFLGTARWLAEMTPGVGALLLWTWHRIGRHGWRDFFGFFSLIGLALGLLAAAKGSRRFAAMPFMVLAGFAGMALELGVLMSLQNLHGYVYGWVGVVTGGFMLGLALGAVAALEGRVAVAARFVLAASGVVSAAAAAVCLSGRALPLVGFPGLAVLAGAFVGVAFRVALRTWTTAKPAAGVGMLYAADLLGGVAGALLIPAILIPAAGLVAGSLAPAVAALPPFIVLAWPRTR